MGRTTGEAGKEVLCAGRMTCEDRNVFRRRIG